jgi:hypothetical protein
MTDLEKQVWSATYATAYVGRMNLGFQRGDTLDSDVCNEYSVTAMDVADSAVLALRQTYDDSCFVHPGLINAHKAAQ